MLFLDIRWNWKYVRSRISTVCHLKRLNYLIQLLITFCIFILSILNDSILLLQNYRTRALFTSQTYFIGFKLLIETYMKEHLARRLYTYLKCLIRNSSSNVFYWYDMTHLVFVRMDIFNNLYFNDLGLNWQKYKSKTFLISWSTEVWKIKKN